MSEPTLFLHSTLICTKTIASNEEASGLDDVDEAPQLQAQKNERVKNLSAGTVLIKPPVCAVGVVLWLMVESLTRNSWVVATSSSICLHRKISRNSRVSMTRWTLCRLLGLELVSTQTKTTKRIFHTTPRCLRLLQSWALCRYSCFLLLSPVCVRLKRCVPFSVYCMCVCLDGFVCNTCWMYK